MRGVEPLSEGEPTAVSPSAACVFFLQQNPPQTVCYAASLFKFPNGF